MSVKKSLAWMGTAQTASFLVQFAASVVLARYLTPHEMGVFAIGLATVGLLSLLQSFGLQPLIVRESTLTHAITTTAFTVNALLAVLLSLATLASAYLGSSFLRDEGVRQVLLVLSVCPLFGIFSFLPGAQLERHARFKEIALISASSAMIGAVTTVVLAMLGFKYMSLAYANVVSSAALALMFIAVGRSYCSLRMGLADWRRVSDFGAQMFAVTGITTFSQRLSEVLLGRILNLAALGLYNRASGLNNMLWGNIHSLLSRVVLVDFARLRREGEPLRIRYMQTGAMITAVLWPAFGALALLAKSIIVILYGTRWVGAAAPLSYLAIASIILVATTMAWEVCTVTGNIRLQTRLEAARAAISVPLFVGGCFISLEAVAFTRVIDAVVAYALYRPHLNRMTGTAFSDFIEIYLQSALLTGCALAPPAIWLASAPDGTPSIASLALTSSLGLFLWGATLFALKHPLAVELTKTVRNRFPRFGLVSPVNEI
ncbi:MAG: oligosaccharide flippase family protein [Sphingomicrobium sp.]|nr:oligosaccharide flippase family protein [Sphingomonadales bacterium]